jgi:hypothetical protein
MPEPAPAYSIHRGRIRLADVVFVYLERMPTPPGPLPPDVAPRAYGVAPTAESPSGGVVAGVGPDEAVWLGFQPVESAQPAIVRVRVDGPKPLDAVTGEPWQDGLSDEPHNHLVCPPDYRLTGIRQADGSLPFGLGDLSILLCGDAPALVPVELVTLERFTSLTGIAAEPLDPDSAYKGWRLP